MPDNVRALRGMKPLRAPDGTKAKRIVLPPKAPAPPKGLPAAASAEWRRVVPELERAGVLSTIDRGVLVAYCLAWSHMMEAEEELKKGGLIRSGREGTVVKSPAWQVWREANRTMILAARECYLTPTARLRIPVPRGATEGTEDEGDLFD